MIKEYLTEYFIAYYLNIEAIWDNKLITMEKAFRRVKSCYCRADKDLITNIISLMLYKDFLKTPYWIAVSYHKKVTVNFRCQICNNGLHLNTHHRNYNYLSREIDNLNELTVLCNRCHKKYHKGK